MQRVPSREFSSSDYAFFRDLRQGGAWIPIFFQYSVLIRSILSRDLIEADDVFCRVLRGEIPVHVVDFLAVFLLQAMIPSFLPSSNVLPSTGLVSDFLRFICEYNVSQVPISTPGLCLLTPLHELQQLQLGSALFFLF